MLTFNFFTVANAQEIDYSFGIDGSDFVNETISIVNDFIVELFPIVGLIAGVYLTFFILYQIILLFSKNKDQKENLESEHLQE